MYSITHCVQLTEQVPNTSQHSQLLSTHILWVGTSKTDLWTHTQSVSLQGRTNTIPSKLHSRDNFPFSNFLFSNFGQVTISSCCNKRQTQMTSHFQIRRTQRPFPYWNGPAWWLLLIHKWEEAEDCFPHTNGKGPISRPISKWEEPKLLQRRLTLCGLALWWRKTLPRH